MSLYKPSVLKAFLEEIGAAPKKRLSQNFLVDGNIVRKTLMLADIRKTDTVLEIGPGPGVLTEAVLAEGAHVIAVEKDRKFAHALQRLQTPDHRLTVHEADILSWPLHIPPQTKCLGNLPYSIAVPILTRLLPRADLFSSITVMVQKEVAERMLACPSTSSYGSLSLFIQFYSTPSPSSFTVEPSCFYPVPKVKSTVIHLLPKRPPDVDPDLFFAMIRKAFQKRRKMIRSSLNLPQSFTARPEDLSLDDFLTLFQDVTRQKPNKPHEQ